MTGDCLNCPKRPSSEFQNFTRFALDRYFEWPATDLAVRGEPLRRDARIDRDFERLAAERALNGFGNFHGISLLALDAGGKRLVSSGASRPIPGSA
jgi:hypothetical protein